ncbi:hypothetical protein CEP54_007494 [Fusarium duplospermum]|uniref:Uncharacterized protein n=1 Tax=Fusarium duplospermum TaxID=1325734 RepID=A0A428Q170_9HYPO|nr:hypothetical protein CEP54_007494 [Fusarium duplospermum]
MKFSALTLFALVSLAVAAPAPEANGDAMSLSDVTKLIEKGEAKVEVANAKECKYRCCNNFGWCPCC